MDQESQDKWLDWEKSAFEILRRGYTDSQRVIAPFQTLFRILIFPTRVECAESWTVFWDTDSGTRKQRYYTSYLRWRRDIDQAVFEGTAKAMPTVEHHEALVDAELVEGLLRRFEGVKIQALAMPTDYFQDAPIDGTMYEVVLGGAFTSSQFRWYADLQSDEPLPEWKSLGQAVREALIDLRAVTSSR